MAGMWQWWGWWGWPPPQRGPKNSCTQARTVTTGTSCWASVCQDADLTAVKTTHAPMSLCSADSKHPLFLRKLLKGQKFQELFCQLEPQGTRLIQGAVLAKRDFPAEGILLCSTTTAFVSGSGVPLFFPVLQCFSSGARAVLCLW